MKKKYKDYIQYGLIIFTVIFIRLFIVGVVNVQGESMYPTLNESHDKVILERYKQFSEEYTRGDIVVIKLKDKHIIKRIIGLPNETIEIRDSKIYINNEVLEEDYISDIIKTSPDMQINIPIDSVFVLGDNRENSADSRQLGPINMDKLEGKAAYRFSIRNLLFNKLK